MNSKVTLAKEMKTFCMLLFDGRNSQKHATILAKVMLPIVNDTLIRMEREENLARYSFYDAQHHTLVSPYKGMIVTRNTMWRGGDHYDWIFYKVTNITPKGNVMVKVLEKGLINDHASNLHGDHFYTKSFVAPVIDNTNGRGKSKMLENMSFHVWVPGRMDFYDGGVVN
jgi:hypothetical protein